MIIVGLVSSEEEGAEITFIAKIFVVGQRAQALSRQVKLKKAEQILNNELTKIRRTNENNNKKENK